MRSIRQIATACGILVFLAGAAIADDIKLKSGKEYKDVEVVKDLGDKLRVRLLDGRSKTILKADIASHVKKETPAQVFRRKQKALGKKDVAGMIALAKWGFENRCDVLAKKLLAKVIKIDKNNEEARSLLGHRFVDGKWRYGRALERYLQKKREKELQAKGWVKIGGEWVDPYTAKCLNAGLVQVGDAWYTKKDAAFAKKGLLWLEGQWYDPKEKAKLDAGMRKVDGKWMPIDELNALHKNPDSPWVLESQHYRIIGTINHRALTETLALCEGIWEPMKAFFGDAPLIVSADDKLRIEVARELETYQQWGKTRTGQSERSAFYSSNLGVFYIPNEQVACVFYQDEEQLKQWARHGACHLFLGAIVTNFDDLKSPMVEALGSYFGSMVDGKYAPGPIVRSRIRDHEFKPPIQELTSWEITQREDGFAAIGFVMHFLREKFPELVDAWARPFVVEKKGAPELLTAIGEAAAGRDLGAEFATFKKEFLATPLPGARSRKGASGQ